MWRARTANRKRKMRWSRVSTLRWRSSPKRYAPLVCCKFLFCLFKIKVQLNLDSRPHGAPPCKQQVGLVRPWMWRGCRKEKLAEGGEGERRQRGKCFHPTGGASQQDVDTFWIIWSRAEAFPVHCPDSMWLVHRWMLAHTLLSQEEVGFHCTLKSKIPLFFFFPFFLLWCCTKLRFADLMSLRRGRLISVVTAARARDNDGAA